MSLRLSFFLLLSFLIHIFVSIFSYQISQSVFIQPVFTLPVYVEVMDTEKDQQKSLQFVEQPQFNHKTPEGDYRLSKHNNYTLIEQKGKPGSGLSIFYEPREMKEGETSFSFEISPSLLGNIDYLEDVETEGRFNLLNTKEVLFYTFYSRVKHQIHWHWEKALLNKLTEMQIERQFMTRIEAFFNSNGYLYSIVVRKKSGLDELDQASIEAIQRAQPFPNPPEKLISDTNSFKLNYTFVLLNENNMNPY